MKARSSLLILLVFFAASVAGFWLLQGTTPERMSSLIFFLLICFYSFITHRPDVLGASSLFFVIVDLSHFLFDQILPVWLIFIGLVLAIGVIWLVLFGRVGWFLAIAGCLAVIELLVVTQFTGIGANLQALLVVAPMAVIFQYYYFQRHRPDY